MLNDQNPSPIISEMAQQRFSPTAGEQKMLGQFDSRMSEVDRTANAGGGAASLPDYAAQENAEKTQRWAAEDAAAKAVRGPGNQYQGVAQAAASPSFAGQLLQDGLGHRARQRNERAFENGGKPETAEELIARMAAKYGTTGAAQSQPATSVQPQSQPQAQPKPAGSMIQQAAGLFSNRSKQIDKAASYARGGKPGAVGFKVTGPGTATSDEIPATTGTGENIRIANGERIVSVEQDKALERIAEMLNYESVDAMFEALTGKPVGPTIKGGKLAAAGGLAPGQTVDDGAGGIYTAEAGFNPGQTAVNLFRDSAQAARVGVDYNQVRQNRVQQDSAPQASLGNEGRAVASPVTEANRHPISVPANRAAAAQPVDNTPPMPLTTRDVVPGGYLDRGNGILAQRGKTGQTNITNVGTEALTDPSKQIVDGSAGALRDQQSNNPYWSPDAQLERMQRRRLMTEVTDPSITDPGVKADAQKGLLILNAGRQGEAQAKLHNAQAGLVSANTEQAQQMETIRGKLLDPNTSQEERARMIQALQAIGGHSQRTTPYQVHDVEEPLDPANPLLGNRKSPRLFDPNKGTLTSFSQEQSNDAVAQAKAAIARGANKAAVNARLKAMGLPEVK